MELDYYFVKKIRNKKNFENTERDRNNGRRVSPKWHYWIIELMWIYDQIYDEIYGTRHQTDTFSKIIAPRGNCKIHRAQDNLQGCIESKACLSDGKLKYTPSFKITGWIKKGDLAPNLGCGADERANDEKRKSFSKILTSSEVWAFFLTGLTSRKSVMRTPAILASGVTAAPTFF